MKIEFIRPFIVTTQEVLNTELNRTVSMEKGEMNLEQTSYTTQDITVIIGVIGAVQGIVMYGLAERTAKNIVSAMLGQPVPVFDRMVESAIAEMGNVITGIASRELEKAGYPCTLAPPTVVSGRGVVISTLSIKRLQIPLLTDLGQIDLSVALRERDKV
ncbi:MAG: chemotaxis protein CheX [Bacillota bacterium]